MENKHNVMDFVEKEELVEHGHREPVVSDENRPVLRNTESGTVTTNSGIHS